jgi:hypothetical protein
LPYYLGVFRISNVDDGAVGGLRINRQQLLIRKQAVSGSSICLKSLAKL